MQQESYLLSEFALTRRRPRGGAGNVQAGSAAYSTSGLSDGSNMHEPGVGHVTYALLQRSRAGNYTCMFNLRSSLTSTFNVQLFNVQLTNEVPKH